jgi:uncharacterized membrane protein
MQNSINLIAIFDSHDTVMRAMDRLASFGEVVIRHAGMMAYTKSGELRFITNEMPPYQAGMAGTGFGAILGAIAMVLVGALGVAGPVLVMSILSGVLLGGLLGRLTGRWAANVLSYRFDDEHIHMLAQRLRRGQAALIVGIDSAEAQRKVQDVLRETEASEVVNIEHLKQRSVTKL